MKLAKLSIKMQIIFAGFGLALAAFMLEWLEYKYLVRGLSTQIYILVLVSSFTALGVWTGHKFSRKYRPAKGGERNIRALNALGITLRECAVLEHLANGHSNKQIARDLGISPNTVKTHIANLYVKLKVNGRMQAVLLAQELRLVA